MSGEFEPIAGIERLTYLVKSTRTGLMTFYLPSALMGIALVAGEHRRLAAMVSGLLIAASVIQYCQDSSGGTTGSLSIT